MTKFLTMKHFHFIWAIALLLSLSLSSCNSPTESKGSNEKVEAKTDAVVKNEEDKSPSKPNEIVKDELPKTPPVKPSFKKMTVEKVEIAKPAPLPPVEDSFHPPTYHFRSTDNQLDARSFGICLEGFTSSECYDDRRRESCPIGISSIVESDDYLEIQLGTSSNCCYGFVGDIGVLNDSTLNLIYHDYGHSHCACNCGFVLTYTLRKECLVRENRIEQLKAFAINGDSESTVLIGR